LPPFTSAPVSLAQDSHGVDTQLTIVYYYTRTTAQHHTTQLAKTKTHIQKANINGKQKIASVIQRLTIEVHSHVMRNAHDEGTEILEMTIEQRRFFEELKFDHVTVVTFLVGSVVVEREMRFESVSVSKVRSYCNWNATQTQHKHKQSTSSSSLTN